MQENSGTSLDEQLAQQQRLKKKHALITTVAALVVTLVAVGGVLLVGQLATPSSQPESASAQVQQALDSQLAQPVDSERRQALQAPLNALKERLTQVTNNSAKAAWQLATTQAMVAQVDALFIDYASGLYDKVETGIDNINQALDQYDADYRQAYETEFLNAQQAFDKGQVDAAQFHNQKTLTINPDYQPAQALAQRLTVLEQVTALQVQIQAASAAENLDREAELLKALLDLDRQRSQEATRYQQVLKLITQRDFNQAFAAANLWLEAGDLSQASSHLAKARQLDPSRPELSQLQAKIEDADKALARDNLIARVEALKRGDQWAKVQQLLRIQLPKHPDEPGLQGDFERAKSIVEAANLLRVYLDRPERLKDDNIQRVAAQDLMLAAKVTELSPSLSAMATAVRDQLTAVQTPVPVQFVSDGRTDIKVLKIGRVGQTKGRVVNLKPGTYQVEGKRKGFKTKLLTLVVNPAIDNTITVICDERI